MALGGFFTQIQQNRKVDEFGLIAARVAEQIGATRAASQSEQQKAAQKVAERPAPTRAVTITENPDGTVTKTETVKNAPKKDPNAEIAEAANEPYAQMARDILEDAAEMAAEQKKRFDALQADPRWSDPTGRRALAKEAGIIDPAAEPGGFIRRGYPLYRKDRGEYERLINDPTRLREAVLAAQFAGRLKTAEAVRPFQADLTTADLRKRQERAEDRLQSAADRAERKDALINLDRLDTSRFESADKVVEWMRLGYSEEDWEKVKGYLEPAGRIKFAEDTKKAEEAKIKQLIAENDAKIRQARENRQEERSDEALEHLILSNENLRRLIERGEKGAVIKTFRGWATSDLIEAVGAEDVDQDALRRKGNSRLTEIANEMSTLIGKTRTLQTEIKSMEKNEKWKVTDIAVKKARLEDLQTQHARLLDEKNRLLGTGFFGGPRTTTKKADPLGIR